MKFTAIAFICLMTIASSRIAAQPTDASATAPNSAPIPLWTTDVPGALGKEDKDNPTLTPFFPKPETATGAAMIVCPGGGYGGLAEHEGKIYALWLNDQGIAAFVLKYRLGSAGYRHPRMLQDAARAIRLVRSRADEWKIDPKRVGIIGSSAGGHLASTLLTHFDAGDPNATDPVDRLSDRPDLGVLCYAVITMGKWTHQGSKHNLLGENPSDELVAELSNELHVTHDTPPCFVWATDEDKAVPAENSIQFGEALRQAHVPFELHIYQRGAHGIGLGTKTFEPAKFHQWTHDCALWLKEQHFGK
jgi:acetyl esterase/lipase